jgi:hypothetical protein
MYMEVKAKVRAPSTTPIPAGVGEMITNRELILKHAMTVPTEIGILKAKKTKTKIKS